MLNLSYFSVFALLALASTSASADNCEPIRARIEANIASKGLADFSVTVVESSAAVAGEVVGSCDNGTKKIVYAKGAAATQEMPAATPAAVRPAAAPAAPPPSQNPVKPAAPRSRPKQPTPDTEILTECKDGSVSVGGNCKY